MSTRENTPSSKRGTLRQKLLFALFASPVIIVGLLLWQKPPKRSWAEEGRVPSSPNAFGIWDKALLIPIVPGERLREELASIRVFASDWELNDAQLQALRDSVYNLLVGYGTGNYEAYRQFRLPVLAGEWNIPLISFRKQVLAKASLERLHPVDQSEETIFREWFRYTLMRQGVADDLSDILDESLSEEGFLKLISTADSAFYIATRTELAPPLDLFATSSENNGYARHNPVFRFRPDPQEVLRRENSITYATIKLFLKSQNDRPTPQFIRCFWASEHKKWLPIEYCVPNAGVQTNVFAF
jgi:hypothetical protein